MFKHSSVFLAESIWLHSLLLAVSMAAFPEGGSFISMTLATSMSKDEVASAFVGVMHQIKALQGLTNLIAITITMPEYDKTDKEIWEFKEAREFLKMVVDMGLYGLLMFPKLYDITPGIELVQNADHRNLAYWPVMTAYGTDGVIEPKFMLSVVRQSCGTFNRDFDDSEGKGKKGKQ